MKVGAMILNDGPAPEALGIGAMAAAAEQAGADGLWVSDHLLLVDAPAGDYPFSADGKPTWAADVDYYEALLSCAAISAATSGCRIGTAVLVLPQRNVLEVAKLAATLDRLSGGRLALGLGAGWSSHEFGALGYEYATRGKRFDEQLQVLRDCWSGRPSAFEGSEVTVPAGVVLNPVPLSRPGPPLLVGGMSRAARRRAATHGDGWLAIAFADRWDPEALRKQIGDVEAQRQALRPEAPFERVLKLHSGLGDAPRVPALVAEAATLGFDEVIVQPAWMELGVDRAPGLIEAAAEAAG